MNLLILLLSLLMILIFIHLGGYNDNIYHTSQVDVGTSDEAGYNTTQHIIQQRSTDKERPKNGVENYAKLQNDEVIMTTILLL